MCQESAARLFGTVMSKYFGVVATDGVDNSQLSHVAILAAERIKGARDAVQAAIATSVETP